MLTNKKKGWLLVIVAGILALSVAGLVMQINQVTPFGDHNFLISDAGTQYVPFLTELQRMLKLQSHSLFSFNLGLGSNIVPIASYYLMSPFNVLLIFFKANQIPIFMTVVIILKISAMAMSMSYYLQRHFENQSLIIIFFALAYSMCGFVTTNYFDIMWLDALIWLPLIMNGLDQINANRSSLSFFIWLTISIVTNYYLGYMTCLFIMFYMIIRVSVTAINQSQISLWAGIKAQLPQLGKVAFTGICSALTAMIVLVPTAVGMLQSAKGIPAVPTGSNLVDFGAEIFSQLGVGGINYPMHLSHAPTIYSSLAVALLAMFYFVHPQISKINKWISGSLLIILFLSMWLKPLNLAWHLFQEPKGFPFRDAFFVSFVLVVIAFAAWQKGLSKISMKWRLIVPGMIILLALGFMQTIGMVNASSISGLMTVHPVLLRRLLVNCIYIAAMTTLFFIRRTQLTTLEVGGLMVLEVTANFNYSMQKIPYGSQSGYEYGYSKEQRQLASVSGNHATLYRINNADRQLSKSFTANFHSYNDAELFGYNSEPTYTSTLNMQTRNMLQHLGLYSKNVRRVGYTGASPVSDTLLAMKYNVSSNGRLSYNPYYRGTAFTVSKKFVNKKLNYNFSSHNLGAVLRAISLQYAPYFTKAHTIVERTKVVGQGQKGYKYLHSATVNAGTTGKLYLDTLSKVMDFASIKVNGRSLAGAHVASGHHVLYSLGNFRKGQRVKISFLTRTKSLRRVLLTSLSEVKLRQALRTVQPVKVKYNQSNLTTTTVNNFSQRWLYLAVPYDSGWHTTLNGHAVTTKKVLGAMTAVRLQKGQNTICMKYQVPGLMAGAMASLAGILLYCVPRIRKIKRKTDNG